MCGVADRSPGLRGRVSGGELRVAAAVRGEAGGTGGRQGAPPLHPDQAGSGLRTAGPSLLLCESTPRADTITSVTGRKQG